MNRCLICGYEKRCHQGDGSLRCPVSSDGWDVYSDDPKQYFCTDRRVCPDRMVEIDMVAIPDDVVRDMVREAMPRRITGGVHYEDKGPRTMTVDKSRRPTLDRTTRADPAVRVGLDDLLACAASGDPEAMLACILEYMKGAQIDESATPEENRLVALGFGRDLSMILRGMVLAGGSRPDHVSQRGARPKDRCALEVGARVKYVRRGYISHVYGAGHGGCPHAEAIVREKSDGSGSGTIVPLSELLLDQDERKDGS